MTARRASSAGSSPRATARYGKVGTAVVGAEVADDAAPAVTVGLARSAEVGAARGVGVSREEGAHRVSAAMLVPLNPNASICLTNWRRVSMATFYRADQYTRRHA
jgi:hypothetical protein